MPSSLQRALHHASDCLSGLDQRPVGSTVDLAIIHQRMNVGFPETGTAPQQVIDELVAMTEGGRMGSASWRFFAWVIGGSTEAALAAEWLTSTWDQNAALVAFRSANRVRSNVLFAEQTTTMGNRYFAPKAPWIICESKCSGILPSAA